MQFFHSWAAARGVGGEPKIVAKRHPSVSNSAWESIFQMNVDLHFTTWKQGVPLMSFSWHTCGVGWLGVSSTIQFFLEMFLLQQTVVWCKTLVNFLGGEKHRQEKEGLCCVGLYFPPRAGGGVWIFGFHNNKKTNKKSIGYPLSVFNQKLYSQTKSQTDPEKIIMYVSICLCVYACVGMCLCVWTSAPACALCASIHGYRYT